MGFAWRTRRIDALMLGRLNYKRSETEPLLKLPRVRLTVRQMMVAVTIAGIVLAFAKVIFIDNRPLDVLIGTLDALVGKFTVYADGFNESKFRSLRVGMTARQVEDIMGPPLERGQWQDSGGSGPITPGVGTLEELWHYSRAGTAPTAGNATANYWRRQVWFRGGAVYSIDRTYYVD